MKKCYMFLLLLPTLMTAQIPNARFEYTYDDGTLRNWGYYYTLLVVVDPETGESTSDHIIYDGNNGFTAVSTDAFNGNQALEIHNAMNVDDGSIFAGFGEIFHDDELPFDTGWNSGHTVPEGTVINFLAFHYKFNALGGELGLATFEVFSVEGEYIGGGEVTLPGAADYTFVSIPANIPVGQMPGFVRIRFSTAAPGATAVFGSRLTVDDVALNEAMLSTADFAMDQTILYPTITDGLLHSTRAITNIKAVDMTGRIFALSAENGTIDVSRLVSGHYILDFDQSGRHDHIRFLKK